ncbi:MAG: family 10 glycosylhydrolase [Kiritimatiellia bacterium]
MTRSILLALCAGVALLAGCGDKKNPIPAAPGPGEAKVLAAWSSLTNAAEVKRAVRASEERTSAAKLLAPGVVEFPADFTGDENLPARVSWDVKLPCDLRLWPGVQFDFYCDDLDQFSSFSCYFKSGGGWYHGSFSPEESGAWQRVTVQKSQCGVEGTPEGWGRITDVRISGWRAGTGRARCALANLAVIGGTPEVAVVYADSLAAKGGAEAKGYLSFAGTVSASLRAVGVEAVIVADTDLTADALRGIAAVVLPYNPQIPAEKLELLRGYVAGGGRLLACYSQPKEVLDLLGVKMTGSKRPGEDGGAAIAGFLRTGAGLKGQPAFAPQSSWMTQIPARGAGVEVVAEWADGKRASLGIPALVRTKTGLFMSHVWLGGTEGASAELMRAIACDLAPSLAQKVAAREAESRRKAAELKAWLADRPSKRGEHRAFWCHSARGLGGDHDWESSIRFLKENGFNVIIPNLCWGGVAFYESKVLPRASDVAVKGDAFEQCRAACRKYGVKMHVWKVCWNMGAHTAKSFADRMAAAGRVQVDAKGKEMPRWLCPSHPENQRLEIEAMVELAKKGPDGIHFDYIRYPGGESCFCAGCRARFEAAVGHAVTNWPGDVRGAKAPLKAAWRAFRVGNISRVVETVARRVRAEAPGVQISAAVFRNPVSDPETVAQDWAHWCQEGWLDFVCNMDYVDSAAMFRSQVKTQMAAAGRAKLYPGIGLSCWQNDGTDGLKLAKQIQAVRDLGLDGFTVFNFDRRAERVLPLMRTGVTRED